MYSISHRNYEELCLVLLNYCCKSSSWLFVKPALVKSIFSLGSTVIVNSTPYKQYNIASYNDINLL